MIHSLRIQPVEFDHACGGLQLSWQSCAAQAYRPDALGLQPGLTRSSKTGIAPYHVIAPYQVTTMTMIWVNQLCQPLRSLPVALGLHGSAAWT